MCIIVRTAKEARVKSTVEVDSATVTKVLLTVGNKNVTVRIEKNGN
jgi:hypothetical protein